MGGDGHDTIRAMRAGIYVRISKDLELVGAGVARQEEDCLAYAEKSGIEVARVYRDNDLSAYAKGVKRPGFDQLLHDASIGVLNTIICYRVDRLARASREWAKVLPLVDDSSIRLIGTADGVDSSSPGGRLILGVLAEVARDESQRISHRVRRQKKERAKQGKWNGGGYRRFGHSPDCTSLIDSEAMAIRSAVDRILTGVSLGAICREWNTAGVTTTAGNKWDTANLSQMLKKPRLSGVIVKDGERYPGLAEIIPEETHKLLVRHLSSNPKQPGRQPAYLLSGILHCGSCGFSMSATQNSGKLNYGCKRGCKNVYISRGKSEKLVDAEVLRFLASTESLQEAIQDLSVESPRGNTLVEQNQLRERLRALTEDFYVHARIPESIFYETAEKINSRILSLESELVKDNLTSLASWDPDDYLQMDVPDKRAFLRLLFSGIVVRPAADGPERLVYVYSQAASSQG